MSWFSREEKKVYKEFSQNIFWYANPGFKLKNYNPTTYKLKDKLVKSEDIN